MTCGIAGALVAQQNQYINSDFITFQPVDLHPAAGAVRWSRLALGPLVGAVLLTVIDAVLARWPSAQHFLYGFLLLFALYVMPGGVVGLFEKWFRRSSREPETSNAAAAPTRIGPKAKANCWWSRCHQELRRREASPETSRSASSAVISTR